jgi:hypothetical protein
MKKILAIMCLGVLFAFDYVQQEQQITVTSGVKTITVDVRSVVSFQPKDSAVWISLSGSSVPTRDGIYVQQYQLLASQITFAPKQKITLKADTATTNVYYLKVTQ